MNVKQEADGRRRGRANAVCPSHSGANTCIAVRGGTLQAGRSLASTLQRQYGMVTTKVCAIRNGQESRGLAAVSIASADPKPLHGRQQNIDQAEHAPPSFVIHKLRRPQAIKQSEPRALHLLAEKPPPLSLQPERGQRGGPRQLNSGCHMGI